MNIIIGTLIAVATVAFVGGAVGTLMGVDDHLANAREGVLTGAAIGAVVAVIGLGGWAAANFLLGEWG